MGPLTALLNRASEFDFDLERGDAIRRDRKLRVIVATVALAMLMLEVLLARMYVFFLGNISAFIAIPIAMFGLSLGALILHWSPRAARPSSILLLLPALLLVTLLSFLALFFLFNSVFNLTHYQLQNPREDAVKTVVLSFVFVPVFAIAGVILSTAFRAAAERIGRLYALDLAGSALACLITPVALHLLDLPLVICLLLATLAFANIAVFSGRRWAVAASLVAVLLVLVTMGAMQRVFTERPDPDILGVRYKQGREVAELRHRWNEVSRVALVRWVGESTPAEYRVLHDDGVSNVHVGRYDPVAVSRRPAPQGSQGIPFVLDHRPKSALVVFAGAGQDMLEMYEYAGGELEVTGVEINGLVPWAVTTPPFDLWNLQAFYDLPRVDLRIDEGRAFLNRDRRKYDVIFAASNGAQQALRTGHVRKFLDTYEAVESYLDHLNEGGVIIFNVQPYRHKLGMFQRLFQQRGYAPFQRSTMVIGAGGWKRSNRVDTLIVKPAGLSRGEVQRIRELWERAGRRTHYAPDYEPNPELADQIKAPPDLHAFVPTDDRPYEERVEFGEFELFPEAKTFERLGYSLSWIKIFTMLFFGAMSVLIVLAFYARRRGPRRLPAWLVAYFMGTGICYMLVQLGLMAKLELFMGKPIYSIAVVLASFLLANGAGSAWVARRQTRGRPPSALVPAIGAAILVPLTLVLIDVALLGLLGLPVAIKAVLALLAVVPLAFVLGMFYPIGVALAMSREMRDLVPMTFGLATLSSVVGSTYAMVAVINLGFRKVILQAELGYLVLAGLVGLALVAARWTRTRPVEVPQVVDSGRPVRDTMP